MAIFTASMDDFLIFDEGIDASTKVASVVDPLSFYDSIDPHRYFGSSADIVSFSDRISVTNAVFSKTLSDSLTFAEEIIPRSATGVFEDFFFMYDALLGPEYKIFYDTLVFVDEFTGVASRSLADAVDLIDSVTYTQVAVRPLIDSVSFVDGFTVWKDDPWFSTYPILEAS